jgi:hypothetical protein
MVFSTRIAGKFVSLCTNNQHPRYLEFNLGSTTMYVD